MGLAACASKPLPPQGLPSVSPTSPTFPSATGSTAPSTWPSDNAPLPAARLQPKSRWIPVRWAELPGFADDNLFEAWNAWLRSCERPGPVFAALCPEVRQLSIAPGEVQRQWMTEHLQPYRVTALADTTAPSDGLLTSYFEPLIEASRTQRPGFGVPLYRPPKGLGPRGGQPWFSRQQIDTLPEARAALAGREIAWIANPVDALVLHIQGSGRLAVRELDDSQRTVRLAFAGTNEQAYKSVGRWLIDQGQLRDASWPAIKNWIVQNPQRTQEMLWSNPRYVFFKEEPLPETDASAGPRGAQGVPLTAGRSIAVDPGSIPYGTPVWLATAGPTARLQRLVFAQDTGSAITGAVRADYFAGAGFEAGELAGRLKQGLQLWVLVPK